MKRIESRIDPYQIHGGYIQGLPKDEDQLIVSDDTSNNFVRLRWRDMDIVVAAEDLRRAIQNAINH